MKVLIIQSDPSTAEAIDRGLQACGFGTRVCADPDEEAIQEDFDLLLVNDKAGERPATETCRKLRQRRVAAPIMVLGENATTEHAVAGLDAGADAYLALPVEFDELLARIRALLRRTRSADARVLKAADLELDLYTRQVRRGDREVQLSNREFALLEYLMRNAGRPLSRFQLVEKVWRMSADVSGKVVDVYVSMLRKKIDDGHDAKLIHTVRGTGYCFGPVSAEHHQAEARPEERRSIDEPATPPE